MEISFTGIEEAIRGLDYRTDKSPKSRLVRTIRSFYSDTGTTEGVRAIGSDDLIDKMWDLGGNRDAIRSKRKNLSSIKSSVNQDLDAAWEDGRNPEGITIGPLNTFAMSDAAKDKILNSFSGSINLEGGNSIDRVAEALKIVTEYLSETPGGVEGEQLSNLKSLVEGLSNKSSEGGLGEFEIIEKKGSEEEAEVDQLELMTEETLDDTEIDEEDLEESTGVIEEEVLEKADTGEITGEDIVELTGAEGLEETDEVELLDEDDLVEEDTELDDGEIEEVMEEATEDIDGDLEDAPGEIEEAADEETLAEETDHEEEQGLPIDQLLDDAMDLDEFQLDEKQKQILAERFDGYLGAMERYYNQYILVRKGSYPIGTENEEADALTEQKVLLADYYIGKYPITNALFEVFVERTGYRTTAEKLGYGYVYHGRFQKVVDPGTGFTSSIWNPSFTRERVDGATWFQPLGPGSTLHKKRNHPVVQVSLRDARAFAAWTGKRLPTEIEWEAAARTLTGLIFPWGNEWVEGIGNLENSGISDTCPVDNFPLGENDNGIADLLGNVMEWTGNECDPKYPVESASRFYIARGGSWISPEQTHLYDRNRFEEHFTSNILGFRCLAD